MPVVTQIAGLGGLLTVCTELSLRDEVVGAAGTRAGATACLPACSIPPLFAAQTHPGQGAELAKT